MQIGAIIASLLSGAFQSEAQDPERQKHAANTPAPIRRCSSGLWLLYPWGMSEWITENVNNKSAETKWTQRSTEWASNCSASECSKERAQEHRKCSRACHGTRRLCYQQLLGPGQSPRHTVVPSVLGLAMKLTCLISYSLPHFCYFDFSYWSLIKGTLWRRALI